MVVTAEKVDQAFRTSIPARLDRLPWSRWHWLVITALGITWIIDGLEVTMIAAFGPVLQEPGTLHFSSTEIGLLGSSYLMGAVLGALVFGYLTDRFGRKKLFTVTLGLYLVSALLTAFSFNFASFAVFRFLTGAAIGGEYSAINSAIDELIPARVRGWADLAINGTFWLGAAAGSLASIVLLDPRLFSTNVGWRLGFGVGAILGLAIMFLRNWVPESPRWLLIHGNRQEAERIINAIEDQVESECGRGSLAPVSKTIKIQPRAGVGFVELAGIMFNTYWRRTVLGLSLIVSQAFLYNGVFFTFPLVLRNFYNVRASHTPLYILPFALSNFLGPVLLGRLFDTIGRRPMIAATYSIAGVLLAATGYLFREDMLSPTTQTLLWALAFFFASSAASSAYLTVSEIFPIELRGMVIALFFATGTLIGGTVAPGLFGRLIQSGSRTNVFYADLLASGLLLMSVVVVAFFGVNAERTSLEEIASPLSAAQDDDLSTTHVAPGGAGESKQSR
jgi:MFS family permease